MPGTLPHQNNFPWPVCVRFPYRATEAYWAEFKSSAYSESTLEYLCHPEVTGALERLYVEKCKAAGKYPFGQISPSLAEYMLYCARSRIQPSSGGPYGYVSEHYFVLLSSLAREQYQMEDKSGGSTAFLIDWRQTLDKMLPTLLEQDQGLTSLCREFTTLVAEIGHRLKPGASLSASPPTYDAQVEGAKTTVRWTSHPALYSSGPDQSRRDLRQELGACIYAILDQACEISLLPVDDIVPDATPFSPTPPASLPPYGTPLITSLSITHSYTISWDVVLKGGWALQYKLLGSPPRAILGDCPGPSQPSPQEPSQTHTTTNTMTTSDHNFDSFQESQLFPGHPLYYFE